MKKNNNQLNSIVLFVIVILCIACNCPQNVKLGDVKMLNLSFFPLKGGETLKYINDNKDILVLADSSDKISDNQIIVESLCSKPPISSQFSYYLGTPNYRLRYVNSKENLRLLFSFQTYNTQQLPRDTVLYDCLIVDYSSERQGTSFQIISSDRGNRQLLEINKTKNTDGLEVVDTIINKRKYEKVYFLKTNPSVLYAEKIGVIAFRHRNQNWYLNQ